MTPRSAHPQSAASRRSWRGDVTRCLLMTDAVDKVSDEQRAGNNRIQVPRFLNQCCAPDSYLESIFCSLDPQKTFIDSIDPRRTLRGSSRPRHGESGGRDNDRAYGHVFSCPVSRLSFGGRRVHWRERMKLGPKHNRTGLSWPNQDREPALDKALKCRRLCNLLQHE